MSEHGESDRSVVPANLPNKAAAAEAGEERERAKGSADGETRPGRSAGPGVSSEPGRVREVARRDKDARFTALLRRLVPKTSSRSCDQAIFVDQAADASVSSDAVLLKIDRVGQR